MLDKLRRKDLLAPDSRSESKENGARAILVTDGGRHEGPESVFLNDPKKVSESTRKTLQSAAQTLQQTDTSEDSLSDAIVALESATEELQDVVNDPGVSTDRVQQAIDRLETRRDNLATIQAAYATAKRKLALARGGVRISRSDVDELRDSVEEAITIAEELDRPTSELQEYLHRIDEELGVTDGVEERGVSEEDATTGETTQATNQATERSPPESEEIQKNELSEWCEVLHNIYVLSRAVAQAGEEWNEDAYTTSDQMGSWTADIENQLQDGTNGYRVQQRARNPFTMEEYRTAFGDGTQVTEFEYIEARPPTPSVQALLDPLLEDDPDEFLLPVDDQTDSTLPVIVESADELKRAEAKLNRLPTKPDPAINQQKEHEAETEEEPLTTEPSDLTEVNVITDSIATALREAGYTTPDDLRAASTEELAEVDGVSEQIAMRIKLQVGG